MIVMSQTSDEVPQTESEVHTVLGTPEHFIVVLKNGLVWEFNQPGGDSYWTQIYPVPNTVGHRLYWKKQNEEDERMLD
ncbi:MAG TPA: hypothetical protein VFT45_19060, partial [Longimicrobium sp.]|nr:hypothetical protein [Longimicrobium sp.]